MTRAEAIEHLKNIAIYSFQDGYTDEARQALDMAIEALRQPERKAGRWIKKVDDGMYWYECSECGDYPLKSAFGHDVYSDWCPHCGADMRGAES